MTPIPVGWEGRDWPNREHSRIVERGGIQWHVQTMGKGPVLLLLHGTGASTHSFRDLMPRLAERFTVVAPDLPGHALSRVPPTFEPSLPSMAAATSELLDELGLKPSVMVGHSAGAAVLARMILDGAAKPELLVGLGAALVPFRGIARAVFLPTARLLAQSGWASKLIAFRARDRDSVERLVESTGSSLDDRGVELYRRLSERPAHVAAVLAMMAKWELEALFSELPKLDVPVLLLAGALDRAVPIRQQREIAERLRRGRVKILPRTGHLLHEENPDVVAAHIFDAWTLPTELVATGPS